MRLDLRFFESIPKVFATPRKSPSQWDSEPYSPDSGRVSWSSGTSSTRSRSPTSSWSSGTSRWSAESTPRDRTLVRHSSQKGFKERDQTIVVFDWDDTLFPTTALEQAEKKALTLQNEQDDFRRKLEECQTSAESLLQSAKSSAKVIIVTLSSRSLLKKRCEKWYPRVWKLLNSSRITVVYAIEPHRRKHPNVPMSEFSAEYWSNLKQEAIEGELKCFYSQYPGQTWKNVVSIGDSIFECFGTINATRSYVQKRFGGTSTMEWSSYVQNWQRLQSDPGCRFDRNPHWSEGLDGIHEGHMFSVRAKVIKLVGAPSPAEVAQQLTLLLRWFPSIVGLDSCLKVFLDDLSEETIKSLESVLMTSNDDSALQKDCALPQDCVSPARMPVTFGFIEEKQVQLPGQVIECC